MRFALLLLIAIAGARGEVELRSPVRLPDRPKLSADGYKLILDYEVGGGRPYYDAKLRFPTWPGEYSGVTIGVGWDCGYNSLAAFRHDWSQLSENSRARLERTIGFTRAAAKEKLKLVWNIAVDWKLAEGVYNNVTVPKFWLLTRNAFPGFDELHENGQAVLLSLTFNRGASFYGTRREEMRAIRDLVPRKDYRGMAVQLRQMKRLWPDTLGLRRRRDAEARLMESVR